MKYEWTVLSFNLRTNTMEDGPNSFSFRFPFLCEVLNQRLPDLIGFQEITEDMRLQLTAALPDYYLVGGGRETDHLGESSCIAFRKDRFARWIPSGYPSRPTRRARAWARIKAPAPGC